jgi:GMP synthase (glutamine-hydrolysing)
VKEIWVLQHTASEKLGTIEDALRRRGVGFHYIETHRGAPVPTEMAGKAGLVVMGGPMSVYEQAQYPFLRDELRLIASALAAQRPVLGVCLGSQLLAAALGAEVKKGAKKELGWYPLTLAPDAAQDTLFANLPPEFWAFHWHGDVFSLPSHAVALAASKQTAFQAFRYGQNAYGLLFHLEVTEAQIAQMLVDFADELRAAGGDAAAIAAQTRQHLAALHGISANVFGRWVEIVEELGSSESGGETMKEGRDVAPAPGRADARDRPRF